MAYITSWNVDPNIPWYVRLSGLYVSLHLTEADALADTNRIARAIRNLVGKVSFTNVDDFVYLGKTYELDKYDGLVDYHVQVTGTGTNVYKIGPFFDIPQEEHPLYKDSDIAGNRALMLIDEHTHVDKTYTLSLPIFKSFELFQNVSVVSDRLKPTSFTSRIEGLSYSMSRNTVLITLDTHKYEKMNYSSGV